MILSFFLKKLLKQRIAIFKIKNNSQCLNICTILYANQCLPIFQAFEHFIFVFNHINPNHFRKIIYKVKLLKYRGYYIHNIIKAIDILIWCDQHTLFMIFLAIYKDCTKFYNYYIMRSYDWYFMLIQTILIKTMILNCLYSIRILYLWFLPLESYPLINNTSILLSLQALTSSTPNSNFQPTLASLWHFLKHRL